MKKEIIGDATLYLGDCSKILKTIKKIDAVVTDPPYGIGESAGKNKSRTKLAKAKDYGNKDWDSKTIDDFLMEEIRSKSNSQIIFGGNYYDLPPTTCWFIWDKLNGKNDFADFEMAWTNLPKACRKIDWLWNGMIRREQEERFHPTQKPLGLMKWCIDQLPDNTTTIFDPFMGSGTTGVASIEMNKKFIGIEKDEEYFKIACKRIRETERQGSFFRKPEKSEQLKLIA